MNTDYIWIAAIVGVSILASGLVAVVVCRLLIGAIRSAYAEGEASGFRKSQDLPPLHMNGPPEPAELDEMIRDDGEFEGAEGMEPEPSRVRVNMSGT